MLLILLLFFIPIQIVLCIQGKKGRLENFFSLISPFPSLTLKPISFLKQDDLFEILISDKDNFFKTFFDYDLSARQVKTLEEYCEKTKNSVSIFSENEKSKIKKCSEECDKYLISVGSSFPGFDGIKASNIPWKFGKITGRLYEHGLSHTRLNDLIVLSDNCFSNNDQMFTRTLIHEKIHLYQKQYPGDIEIYMNKNNIIRHKKREYSDYIRPNPDLDEWIYKDKKTEFIFKAEYNSKLPKNILDVKITNQIFEHPFEKMAIDISNNYK